MHKNHEKTRFNERRVGYSIAVTVVLAVLFIIGLSYLWHSSRTIGDVMIGQEVVRLRDIFQKIDATCSILGFEHQRNYIDFLTVKSFVGSEVGAVNLAHPAKWEGPYLQDNPTVQQKLFEIVRIKNGYYIVPGEGIKLSSGKVIGKDIIFNDSADMQTMIAHKGVLNFKGQALAAYLEIGSVDGSAGEQAAVIARVEEE
jgi:hypothetical protein